VDLGKDINTQEHDVLINFRHLSDLEYTCRVYLLRACGLRLLLISRCNFAWKLKCEAEVRVCMITLGQLVLHNTSRSHLVRSTD